MSVSWMLLLGIEGISLAILFLGVALYRYVLADHRMFIDSLQHTEKQHRKERMGVLAWTYIFSTAFLNIIVTIALFHISPLF